MSITAYPGLALERADHTAIVTLTNPPAHVWTPESLSGLTRLVLTECGLGVDGFNDLQVKDQLECFHREEVARS